MSLVALSKKSQRTEWDLLVEALKNEHKEEVKDANLNVVANADVESVRAQLTLLGNQTCTVCSGYGHRGTVCPTKPKLRAIATPGSHGGKLISNALKKVESDYKAINAQCQFSHISGKKRPAADDGFNFII